MNDSFIKDIQTGAIILAAKLSAVKTDNMTDEALYKLYGDEVSKYFHDIRKDNLFNGQKMGENLEEERLEKELMLTYLFWPNDTEFLNVQMTKSGIITQMLKGVNYRFDYLKGLKADKVKGDTPKAEPLAKEKVQDDDIEFLAENALVSYEKMQKECQSLQTALTQKEQEIASLAEYKTKYLDLEKKFTNMNNEKALEKEKTDKYVRELLRKIEALQKDNEQLTAKVNSYDQMIPNLKNILINMQDTNVAFKNTSER